MAEPPDARPAAARRLDIELPSSREAPGLARRAIQRHLQGRATDDERRTSVLLVSELVTNAIRHAGSARTSVRLVVEASFPRIRVEVHDQGPGFQGVDPQPHPGGEGGFGLVLVSRMADRWGVQGGGGSRVWFELDQEPARGPG